MKNKDTFCDRFGHGYIPMPGNKDCKYAGGGKDAGFDNSLCFHILFCSKCGGTLEVVSEDRRWQRSRKAK